MISSRQSEAGGFDRRRLRLVLPAVYGLLSTANLAMMITEPTVWQGVFAAVLLGVGLWLWLDAHRRRIS